MSGQPAARVERLLLDRLSCLPPTGTVPEDLFGMVTRVDCQGELLKFAIEVAALTDGRQCDDMLVGRAQQIDPTAIITDNQLRLTIDAKPVRRGKTIRAKVHLLDDAEKRQVPADLVRTAHGKLTQLNASPLDPERHQQMVAPINEWTRERIVVGLLAPDIQKALLQGTAPAGLDPDRPLSRDMPLDWAEQRRFLGMSSE